jgi:isocitrate dehydrogenase (NAD+)
MSDGMFLSACREVSKGYPDIAYDEDLLDRVCLQVSWFQDAWDDLS